MRICNNSTFKFQVTVHHQRGDCTRELNSGERATAEELFSSIGIQEAPPYFSLTIVQGKTSLATRLFVEKECYVGLVNPRGCNPYIKFSFDPSPGDCEANTEITRLFGVAFIQGRSELSKELRRFVDSGVGPDLGDFLCKYTTLKETQAFRTLQGIRHERLWTVYKNMMGFT